ncbi:PLP-dependent transferase [Polychaeton citri CBS 116435]|uniref:PLP-dependent transferase n=1 Tax=Polychaeton citri CBS 116435 TaxID=1314669 RepID=A0A9P4Q0B2_9PEZI|nr:PLP-dependent transferase [Polychaeton citri CBS 116435]
MANDGTADKPMSILEETVSLTLERRKAHGGFRRLTLNPPGSVDFSSNDFLSLAASPRLRSQYLHELREAESTSLGSGGSRLLDGNSTYAEELERQIAAFHGARCGLLSNSGFDANVSIFSTLPQPGDIIIYDEYIHASVHDGMRLSRATKKTSFAHNSVSALKLILESLLPTLNSSSHSKTPSIFIAVEAIYSMDGDIAPLTAIHELMNTLLSPGTGHLIVDEAHSTGVLGPRGRGLVSDLKLESHVTIRLHTFGKALAANGAIILCTSPILRTYLFNYARPLIYTTFLSLPTLAAVKASYTLLSSGQLESKQAHVTYLISSLHSRLLALDSAFPTNFPRHLLQVPLEEPKTPIFSLQSSKPKELAAYCQRNELMVRGIVAPTVPLGKERIRVCLHGGNTEKDLERLVKVLGEWVEEEVQGLRVGRSGELGEQRAPLARL